MYEVLLVIYLVIAVLLIALVLVQQGKGADMGSSFGAGASATLFGSSGHGNFLTKSTTTLAIIFFCISLALGYMNVQSNKKPGEFDTINAESTVGSTDIPAASGSDVPSTNVDVPVAKEATSTEEVPSATSEKTEATEKTVAPTNVSDATQSN